MEGIIEYYDYLLLLPYFVIFFLIARKFAKKHAETTREFYWLLISWWMKMAAGILYAWMIVYYYGYGDPIGYKDRSDALLDSILKNWENIKYIFLPAAEFKDYLYSLGHSNTTFLTIELAYYTDQNFMISRISCLAAFFTFNRFLLISLVFTNIAYYGFLIMYTTSKKIIKGYNKELAISCLLIPSCIFWSSGLAKEPICILALGIIFNCVVKIFFQKKVKLSTILGLLFFSYVLFTVKNYIFFCFSFAFIFWLLYNGIKKLLLKSILIKLVFLFLAVVLVAGASWFYGDLISTVITDSIGGIISLNIDMYEVMASRQRGSFIDVGDIDVSSVSGVLKFIPQGLINVFFRPFPWEILNILMIFTVLENLFFIYLLFRVFIKSQFFTHRIFIHKNYQVFAIIFSLTLAFAIAISTFNFGSMVRYKMPFLPFWASFLLIMNKKLSDDKRIVELQT
jgi:hypothetical protein